MSRVERWERRAEIPLLLLGIAFLVACVWPVLDVRLTSNLRTLLEAASCTVWMVFAAEFDPRVRAPGTELVGGFVTAEGGGEGVANENDEEALDYVTEQAALTPRYLIYMTLAGVLAGVGLLSNSVPILVGSMVIAPALPPIALVAFGVVHRKAPLALRGLGVGVLGLLCAAVAAFLVAVLMRVTDVIPSGTELLNKPMLEERVRPGWWSLVAAVAGGIVGVTALTEKKTDTLIGTVAALALVPAAAAAAVAALATDLDRTLGGLLLLGMNFGLVVAMGILTLLVLRREPAAAPIVAALLITVAVVLLLALAHTVGVTPGEPPAIPTTPAQ